jgi:photosystem II stability/assembly factor-like uncharacterized protein
MRIDDVSPDDQKKLSLGAVDQSVSGKALCVALSSDGTRAYIGGHSGVWRSDDGGETWWHPEWPEPPAGSFDVPGALPSLNVYDVGISPSNNDLVFAGTGNDAHRPDPSGIYRSNDGAQSWTLRHQFIDPSSGDVFPVGQLAIAGDDSQLMFAAGGVALARSVDGGTTWTEVLQIPFGASSRIWHVVIAPSQAGGRRIYACGTMIWESLNGGDDWTAFSVPVALGGPGTGGGTGARGLGLHPTDQFRVYLSTADQIWRGLFPAVTPPQPPQWLPLAPVPIIPNGPTESGVSFIIAHLTPDGTVVFIASDRRTTCIAAQEPRDASAWHRIDATIHVDPHGIAFTPDLQLQFPDGPAHDNHGRLLIVNDGGAYASLDGAASWSTSAGLSTLNVCNAAVSSIPGQAPLLTFGAGDNNGFASDDGGENWRTQGYLGGDNDCSFSDPRQPTRMYVFAPRSKALNGIFGEIYGYVSQDDSYPDIKLGSSDLVRVLGPDPRSDAPKSAGWNVVSAYWNIGYRPLVLTPADEMPRPDGDLIAVRFTDDQALLLRTTAMSAIASSADWATGATDESAGAASWQVGPPLPSKIVGAVQASGGHDATVYYAGDARDFRVSPPVDGTMQLWKWTAGMPTWRRIVPARRFPVWFFGPTIARRFFVDPYRPNLLYVLGEDHVYRSEDGGSSWIVDASLEQHLTANGAYPLDIPYDTNPEDTLLRDMQFDAHRYGLRFATGPAGAFYTADGVHWNTMLTAIAHGVRPTSIIYDDRSCDRALYVGTMNRGLLRVSPIPPDWEFPIGSLQAAEGRVTLLRVHELGSGYGPADDQLDAEVIVWLDSQPEKAFGFQLRKDDARAAAEGKLSLLRNAFDRDARVHIEFIRTGCRTAQVIRVIGRD